jgi:hypothetical protein
VLRATKNLKNAGGSPQLPQGQTIAEIERANTIEGPGLPSVGRTQSLNAIFDDLIAALRCGGVNEQARLAASTVDSSLDSKERELLLRRYIIEQIGQHKLEASPAEAAIVPEWAWATGLRRVREENHRLRALLDGRRKHGDF